MNRVWKLISPFWFSKEKYKAWGLLGLIIVVQLAIVYTAVLLNEWYGSFYNSLQEFDKASFYSLCVRFAMIASIYISIQLVDYYANNILGFRWRKWLTEYFIDRWLQASRHYRMRFQAQVSDNPDQRISNDLNFFSEKCLELFVSFFKESINLISFLGILWAISGPLNFTLFGHAIHIPGYMVWVSLIYSIVGTWITFKVGKPVIALDYDQEKYEANFRYALVRAREKSEEIAVYEGHSVENQNFKYSFKDISQNFYKIVKRQLYISACQSYYVQASVLFPMLAAAPMFFSKMITLGVLMQINSAFTQVQGSLSILVKNFDTIAKLRAATRRLLDFSQQMDTLPEAQLRKTHAHPHLSVENLTLQTPEGNVLFKELNFKVDQFEKVLIMGKSGFGKSTLLRAIAGLWPFGEGNIFIPGDAKVMLVPQKPYLPLGTLSQALCYPHSHVFNREELENYLNMCHLGHLIAHLETIQDWGNHLSLGEQQRVGFIRALLFKPDWLIMDEPSAALDKQTESLIYRLLSEHLPNRTLITIGHSPSLKAYHDRVLWIDQSQEADQPLDMASVMI